MLSCVLRSQQRTERRRVHRFGWLTHILTQDRADKGSNERLGSSQDLESSLEDATSLKALKIRTSLSSSELEGNEASSSEDMLSSKDSLNSIPGTPTKVSFFLFCIFVYYLSFVKVVFCLQTESSKRSLRSTTSLKLPLPDSPRGDRRPNRELFEGWAEYVDDGTCRPFYYNRETRARSWKPPRRSGPSPRMRVLIPLTFFEEEGQPQRRGNGRRKGGMVRMLTIAYIFRAYRLRKKRSMISVLMTTASASHRPSIERTNQHE